MSDAFKGALAMAGASAIWGLSGMYYKLLDHVPAIEVLVHRTIWSFVFFLATVLIQKRMEEVVVAVKDRRTVGRLALSGAMISVNWFGFIFAIQSGYATESALGYYIFPLVAIGLGFVFFRERFKLLQGVAIGFAVAAVLVLTIGLGTAPWIALILATTFGFYGMIKKTLATRPAISVTVEIMLLLPFSFLLLGLIHAGFFGGTGTFGSNWRDSLLLILSGPLTSIPLMLFSYATRRISLATVGLVQYLNPTLQFLVAVFYFMEPFTMYHAVAFGLIWTGLALYSFESVRQERLARRRSIKDGTSGTGS
jgi:chloramphenicol-sensitive protein RarD